MANTIVPAVIQLIASSGFYGSERVVANICRTLSEYQIFVICLGKKEAEINKFREEVTKEGNVKFTIIRSSFCKAFYSLWKLYCTHPPLVIHAHGYKEAFIACLFRLVFPCRVIITQHGFTERNRKSRFYNFINKSCCRWGNVVRIICVSQKIFYIYKHFGVKHKRLQYLPNGILLAKKPEEEQRLKAKIALIADHNLPTQSTFILFAGRLSAEKDPLLFLNAFAKLHEKMPHTYGLIAGEGPLTEDIKGEILKLGLQNSVSCLGFVPEINKILLGSDILMLTSITEGTPMITLEAMASGTVVIATAVGDLPKLLGAGKNGIVIKSRDPQLLADHAHKILTDKRFKETVIENGRKNVEKRHNFKHQYSFYCHLYKG